MTDRDPVEMIARTVPFSPEPGASVEHDAAIQALFEETIMKDPRTRRPVWQRPLPVVGAAAAATVLIAGGLLTIGGDAPSAYAQVVDATEAVAGASSGVVVVEIDIREDRSGDGETTSGKLLLDYAFSGDDYRLRSEMIDFMPVDEFAGPAISEVRVVDGVSYTDIGDGRGWISFPLFDPTGLGREISGFGRQDADPGLVLDLVKAASDVSEVSTDDGVTTFTGSVAASTLEAMDDLPAGLAMVAGQPGNLPEQVRLTIEVADDTLRSIRLDAVGNYPGSELVEPGFIDASITTTYDRIGEDIVIDAPPADEVTEQDAGTTEMMENALIVSAYLEEHPECLEASDAGLEGEAPTDPEAAAEAFVDEVAGCFEAAGAPEVAEAWRAMNAAMQDLPDSD